MINFIIFSKDRACQVDLAIRTTLQKCPQISTINVLFKASDNDFMRGYEHAKNNFKREDVRWFYESNFKPNILSLIESTRYNYTLLMSDDSVWIRRPDINMLLPEIGDQVVCASVRMGVSCTYCYPQNLETGIPSFIRNDHILKWDWTKQHPNGDWGYPHGIDSNIYPTSYLLNLISNKDFNNPPRLEERMNDDRPRTKPFMVSERETSMISINNNRSQTVLDNRNSGSDVYSLENLNKVYCQGGYIDAEDIYTIKKNRSVHIEHDYKIVNNGL